MAAGNSIHCDALLIGIGHCEHSLDVNEHHCHTAEDLNAIKTNNIKQDHPYERQCENINNNSNNECKNKNKLRINESGYNLKLSKFITNKALIFIASNAFLIHYIVSVKSFDNHHYNSDNPLIFQLMTQPIQQFRYNQQRNGSGSDWSVEDNSRRASTNNIKPLFSDYVKDGQKATRLKGHIKNVLKPRVSGTQGNLDVRHYITQHLNQLGYSVQVDAFRDMTPYGEVSFGNVIADSNPSACKQLVLACHYDSKKMEGFLGATDSAVPCAILLEIAQTLKDFNLVNPQDPKVVEGVRLIFFDGEEAFFEWTDTDSLYGSRHLARRWSNEAMPKECGNGNELQRISLFVLLDLIGSKDTKIPRYFNNIDYHKLMTLERQYVTEFNESRRSLIFNGNYNIYNLRVQDDHVPFYTRKVPTLLLLSSPFPSVWHTIDDNHDCIDYVKTVRTLAIMDRFTLDYLTGNKNP